MDQGTVFDFHRRNFVVIGATSGIGRQITDELLSSGAHVLAVARRKALLHEMQQEHPALLISAMDVTAETMPEDLRHAAEAFVSKHGKIHGMVYTAGVTGVTPLRGYDEMQARTMMETSLWGAVRSLQILARKKMAQRAASFVILSSTAGRIGGRGMFAYAAAKAAITAAVKSLTHDLARDGHRINTISPAYVVTEMTERYNDDMGEPERIKERHLLGLGTPAQVSGMALFLLSDRATWITGQDFAVDGGYLCGAWT